MPKPLPIDAVLAEIVGALGRSNRLILRAPPGAGKTTRVPAALLDARLAEGGEILVLEPRRIAARAAAEFVARERGETLGDHVGYRVRLDARGGDATSLWFVTEGIFGRRLARDPFLERVRAVVLDEFHERRLAGDVALGVVRELQDTVRPDLRLVVMSATLETEPLARFLPGAAVVTAEGRAHPVTIDHAAAKDDRPLHVRVAGGITRALADPQGGDVLVFLPGAAEIRRVARALEEAARLDADVVRLHGDLPLEEQRRALEPGPRRRVVLATNVAETSLTIEGVGTVVDAGLAREARFDARHGVNRLRTVRVSRASADQRTGRAGRLGPGRCLRLWTRAEHAERRERETPEVSRLELSSTVLELRAWGLRDPRAFPWLDAPPAAALERAERFLSDIGAIEKARALDETGAITELGRGLLGLAVEPRLARILVEAERLGIPEVGALLAALASEEDVRADVGAFAARDDARAAAGPSDLVDRAELFLEAGRRRFGRDALRTLGVDAGAARTVERTRQALCRAIRCPTGLPDEIPTATALRALLPGFPDRVVRRHERGSMRGTMVGGAVVALEPSSVVRDADLFLALDIRSNAAARGQTTRVFVASAIERDWLAETFPSALRDEREIVFDPERRRVVTRHRERLHDLVLDERVDADVDRAEAGEILARAILADRERRLPLGDADRAILDRLRFLAAYCPELGLATAEEELLAEPIRRIAAGKRALDELGDLLPAIVATLPHAARAALDRDAPERFALPSGKSTAIRYPSGRPPVAAARLQELFGLAATPRLARGRVPLVLEILSPSRRPVQVTDDLASFWSKTYTEVRKELRGRYPKHAWPEDPRKPIDNPRRER